MSAHELIVTISPGRWIQTKVICNASSDAACRNMPECQCEGWDLQQDDQGWFHVVDVEFTDAGEATPVIHRHSNPSDCNTCEWLNADDPVECFSSSGPIDVATIPINPVWTGDYYEWEPA